MLAPACTGFGNAAFVTVKSGPDVPTSVLIEAVLFAEFGSAVDEFTDTVSVIAFPFEVPAATFTTRLNVPAVDAARLTFGQTTFAVFPMPGVVQLQPAGTASETKAVLAGIGDTMVALCAALGPILVTAWV